MMMVYYQKLIGILLIDDVLTMITPQMTTLDWSAKQWRRCTGGLGEVMAHTKIQCAYPKILIILFVAPTVSE